MGLKSDIYDALTDSMGDLNGAQEESMQRQADLLAESFVNFLTKQEFRIVKMESDVNVKSISTERELRADIDGSKVKYINPSGTPTSLTGNTAGVKLPALKLKSGFGQGGALTVKATGNINQTNYLTDQTSTGKSKKTVVKLFPGEIKDMED